MPIADGRDAKLPEFNLLIEGSDLTLHLTDLITAQHVLIPHIDVTRPGPQKETTRKEEPEDHECPDAILVAIAFFHKSGFYRMDGDIQLYTADTGAIGKSYHYFDYLCRHKYGFYTAVPISKEEWLGQFSFQQNGEQGLSELRQGQPL